MMSDALVEKIRKIVAFCDDCGFASVFVTRDMLAEAADRLAPPADAKTAAEARVSGGRYGAVNWRSPRNL